MEEIASIFAGFADTFVGAVRAEKDIALPGRLDRPALDYSRASLAAVDAYLQLVHESSKPKGLLARITSRQKGLLVTPEIENTVLWGGAYIGEVLRRAQPAWYWVDYDDYVAEVTEAIELLGPRSVGNCGLLIKADRSMTMPTNKILRYLQEGKEHATQHYVSAFA